MIDTTYCPPELSPKLKARMTKWKEALKDAAVGPLIVAPEIVEASLEWDPKKNDGRSFSGALEDALGAGKNLRFFKLRALAVKAIGGMRDARMFEHHAAVWLIGKASDGALTAAVKECAIAYNQNHSVPLMAGQVRRVCADLLGVRPRTRISDSAALLAEIARLKAELAARDEELEELRASRNGTNVPKRVKVFE